MGDRRIMAVLKVTLFPLALCLLICLLSNVSGNPNPGHLLIETKDKDADYNDYTDLRHIGENLAKLLREKSGNADKGNDYFHFSGPCGCRPCPHPCPYECMCGRK